MCVAFLAQLEEHRPSKLVCIGSSPIECASFKMRITVVKLEKDKKMEVRKRKREGEVGHEERRTEEKRTIMVGIT